jgi:DNA (cytosine-5)-methyltransferase 1
LSIAGKGAGMKRDSGTRSGLLWEVERILKECAELGELPDILLMENVPQVHGKKNLEDFNDWLAVLESLGYRNFWKDLNAKDYGVAQNRNRCFCVSILGDTEEYRFPEPVALTKVMADYLDEEVPEKYYINNERAQCLIDKLIESGELEEFENASNRV